MNIKKYDPEVREILLQMALHFDFYEYSIKDEYIDYKLFERVEPEEIALYFAELIAGFYIKKDIQ